MRALLIRAAALVAAAFLLMVAWFWRSGVIRETRYTLLRDGTSWHRLTVAFDHSWQSRVEDRIGEMVGILGISNVSVISSQNIPAAAVPYLALAEVIHARTAFAATFTEITVYDPSTSVPSEMADFASQHHDAHPPTGMVVLHKSRKNPQPAAGTQPGTQNSTCILFIDDQAHAYRAMIKEFEARFHAADPLTLQPLGAE